MAVLLAVVLETSLFLDPQPLVPLLLGKIASPAAVGFKVLQVASTTCLVALLNIFPAAFLLLEWVAIRKYLAILQFRFPRRPLAIHRRVFRTVLACNQELVITSIRHKVPLCTLFRVKSKASVTLLVPLRRLLNHQ